MVAILLTDLLVGIGIGLAMGFVFILLDQLRFPCYTVVSPSGAVLKRVQLQEQVSFLNKASLATLLEELEPGSRIELDGTHCRHIDHDVLEFISAIMTLLPGDVILTGTPAGVGPLAAGDTVEVEIDGIGVLRNEVA